MKAVGRQRSNFSQVLDHRSVVSYINEFEKSLGPSKFKGVDVS
jgi:hypothetical protein